MPFVPVQEEEKIFEVFRGHQPSNVEMNRWPEDKFLSLIEFFKQFLGAETKKWAANKESVGIMYKRFYETNENIYWREFLTRIDYKPEGKTGVMHFTQKMKGMHRLLTIFFHRNPAYITPKVTEACQGNPLLETMLETFKVEKTQQGTEIVTQSDTSGNSGMGQKTPEVLYQSGIYKALDLFNTVLNSISAHEIKKMSTKEKFDAVSKMAFVLNTAKSNKTKSQVFIGLNVGKENRQSLEDKLQEYQQEQERLSEN